MLGGAFLCASGRGTTLPWLAHASLGPRLGALFSNYNERKMMKIKTIVSQDRRDFTAVYECEGCGFEHTANGYDDRNFHENVIPDMECPECGEKAPATFRALRPKYDADVVI